MTEDELRAIEVLYEGDIPQEWRQHKAQIDALIAEVRNLKQGEESHFAHFH